MELKEANKIIAEYMGWDWKDHGIKMAELAVPSLDALVPVWSKYGEKILVYEFLRMALFAKMLSVEAITIMKETRNTSARTFQEAACIATAKAIQGII